ncbi:MAG: PLP-dependent lyase/thiolase [Bdellovibrionota bacterium]
MSTIEAIKTPLIKDPLSSNVLLKLEYKQPGSSYKIRGLTELFKQFPALPNEIEVLSAGNMARTLLMMASKKSRITVCVPDYIPKNKEEKLNAFSCKLKKMPIKELWKKVEEYKYKSGEFLIHPCDSPEILSGYSSLIDEVLEEKLSPAEVHIPFGVGGLFIGVARKIRKHLPNTRITAVESSYSHPLLSSLSDIKNPSEKTWIDAIGTPHTLPRVLKIILDEKLLDAVHTVKPVVALQVAQNYFASTDERIEGAAAASLASAQNKVENKFILSQRKEKLIGAHLALLTGANVDASHYAS